MAQDGDTITYTYSDGTSVAEDISQIGEITVDYLNGGGGESSPVGTGQSGGRAENVVVDVSEFDTLYLWVGFFNFDDATGRYGYEISGSIQAPGGYPSGSTEISFFDTDETDGDDQPFLVGAGGGGGGKRVEAGRPAPVAPETEGLSGLRSSQDVPPPQGGSGQNLDGSYDFPAEGATDAQDEQRGYILDSGTTIDGGGSGPDTAGEIQITFSSGAPDAPTNVQITDATTEDELTLDWDEVSSATSYNVYRAEASGTTAGDYTLVANLTSPPYTDTGLEDGEQYYYRVSSQN